MTNTSAPRSSATWVVYCVAYVAALVGGAAGEGVGMPVVSAAGGVATVAVIGLGPRFLPVAFALSAVFGLAMGGPFGLIAFDVVRSVLEPAAAVSVIGVLGGTNGLGSVRQVLALAAGAVVGAWVGCTLDVAAVALGGGVPTASFVVLAWLTPFGATLVAGAIALPLASGPRWLPGASRPAEVVLGAVALLGSGAGILVASDAWSVALILLSPFVVVAWCALRVGPVAVGVGGTVLSIALSLRVLPPVPVELGSLEVTPLAAAFAVAFELTGLLVSGAVLQARTAEARATMRHRELAAVFRAARNMVFLVVEGGASPVVGAVSPGAETLLKRPVGGVQGAALDAVVAGPEGWLRPGFDGVVTAQGRALRAYVHPVGHGDSELLVALVAGERVDAGADEERTEVLQRTLVAQRTDSLGRMARGLGHEFNNLLAVVLGNVELLELTLGDHPARARLDTIREVGERAVAITRQMLAYAGKGSRGDADLDLADLVQEMEPLIAVSSRRRATVDMDLEPAPVVGDSGAMRHVVMSLVQNAIEAYGEARGTVVVRTRTEPPDPSRWATAVPAPPEAADAYAVLEVEDAGEGMDEHTMAHAFDPFYSTRFPGRGLGLAAVLGVARMHGGAVRIDSEPGVGTRVAVVFPRRGLGEDDDTPTDVPVPAGRPRTVALVVDDEAPVRAMLDAMLASAGMRVLVASDGESAIELFETHANEVDVVVLDVMMPGLRGDEVAQRLRETRPGLPIVFCTGYVEHNLDLEELPGAVLLDKPIRREQLVGAVHTLVSRARA